jgi:DNA-binding phage protein
MASTRHGSCLVLAIESTLHVTVQLSCYSCAVATSDRREATSGKQIGICETTTKEQMAKRSKDWNEGLARDLRDLQFAQHFVLAALEEDISLQQILGKVIRAYGVKEYAKKAKMPSSNIVRAVDPSHNPTQATLTRLLRPLGLRLTVAPEDRSAGAA